MGQKAHPYGLRLGYINDWKSRWFLKKGYSEALHEDLKIRNFLKKELAAAGCSSIEIERKSGKLRIQIYTARPGIIIGRRGQEIDRIKDAVADLTKSEIVLDIKEVKVPQTDAQLVSENIALQLEKRVSFRKAMKKSISSALAKGAGGIKVMTKGRLGGSEIARAEGYLEGKVPLGTFRANVNYGFAEAFTTYGTIGVKVWIYLGEILVKKEEAVRQKERQLRKEALEAQKHPVEAVVHATEASEEKPEATVTQDPPAPPQAEKLAEGTENQGS